MSLKATPTVSGESGEGAWLLPTLLLRLNPKNRSVRLIPPHAAARRPPVRQTWVEPELQQRRARLPEDRQARTRDRQNTSAGAAEPDSKSQFPPRVLSRIPAAFLGCVRG